MTIEISLSRPFLQACDLYYLKPETILDHFAHSISLADFYSGKGNQENFYGTSYFLEFISRPKTDIFPAKKIREKYLDYQDIVFEAAEQYSDIDNKFDLLDSFYKEWHYELIRNISKKDAIIDFAQRQMMFGYRFD